jgi:hypothetical protein
MVNKYSIKLPENNPFKDVVKSLLCGVSIGTGWSNSTNRFRVLCSENLITIETDCWTLIKKVAKEVEKFNLELTISDVDCGKKT